MDNWNRVLRDMPIINITPITNSICSSNETLFSEPDQLRAGGWGDVWISLYKFNLSSIPAGSTIISAKLKLYRKVNGNTLTSPKYQEITSYWDSTVKWSSKPSGTDNNSGTTFSMNSSEGSETELDLTSLVNSWFSGAKTNYGISINGGSSYYNNYWAIAHGTTATNSSYRPYLEVEYDVSSFNPHFSRRKLL